MKFYQISPLIFCHSLSKSTQDKSQ